MAYDVLPDYDGQTAALNYGFDKIRFLSPVPSGARIRGRFVLTGAHQRGPNDIQRNVTLTVEIEGHEKPALIAEWISLTLF
jgi:acyl dehydratase